MHDVVKVVMLTTAAGAAIPIGGVLARIERIQPAWLEREFRHAVIAFGGGTLLSAVALVLVPEGVKGLPLFAVVISMCLGGLVFCLLDVLISRAKTSAAQLVAMLSDFLPEAMALGAVLAANESLGVLLALLIALQNLPEGFNAYRELLVGGRMRSRSILVAFVALVPIGPLAGLIGLHWLASYPTALHATMLFAAGGILYLTFQDIAPQAKLERHWAPAIGAVAGFLFGLVGQLLLAAR
ncbi:MAG: divalent cation transporter [Candidatus Eisenbacteria bacterium]